MTSPSSAESAPTASKSETPEAGPLQTLRDRLFRGELGQLPVVLTLVLIAIFFEITSHGIFFSPQNLSNLILQIATIGFLGLGSVLVLLIAEIDLSLAAVASLCGAVLVVLSAGNYPHRVLRSSSRLSLGWSLASSTGSSSRCCVCPRLL